MKQWRRTGWSVALVCSLAGGIRAETTNVRPRVVTLEGCLADAIRKNLLLRIERLSPSVAEDNVVVAQGYYDPLWTTDARRESASDSGGFDPVDFSRDAVYSAESVAVRSGLTGFAPSGLSYALGGSYAHSSGERNLLNFDSYGLTAGIEAQQPLLKNLWIDAPRLAIRVNQKLLQISELGVRFVLLDLINRVQWAYYELLFAREHHEVQEQLRAARRRLLAGMERQVQQGVLTPSDLLPARVQLSTVETALIASSNAVVLAEHALLQLMDDDFRKQAGATLRPVERLRLEPTDLNLQNSWSRGLMDRPDLAQLRVEVERLELDVRFRRNQLFPSLNLIAGYGRRGASTDQLPPPLEPQASAGQAWNELRDGSVPSDLVGVVFSLPLSRATERAAFRASRKLREQAELRVRLREEEILREIADAFATAQSTGERARSSRETVELAAAALSAEERKLAGGRSSIFFVLQIQNEHLAAQSSELRAQADHLQALSQLAYADGALLQGIDLRFAPDGRSEIQGRIP